MTNGSEAPTASSPGGNEAETKARRPSAGNRGNSAMSENAEKNKTAKENWKTAVLALNAARRFREAGGGRLVVKDQKSVRDSFEIQPSKDIESGYDYAISAGELVTLLSLPVDMENLTKFGPTSADVARKLQVNSASGVQSKDIEKRRETFGSNVIPQPPHKSFWAYVWDACQDVTLIILFFCAIASLVAGLAAEGVEEGWYDGVGIFVAIAAVILITAVQDYRQDLQFRELDAKTKDILLHVTRDGVAKEISISDLVVGEIVNLSTGDQIPADGLVLSSQALEIDESSMTGESDLMKKDAAKNPFLLSGTKVTDGYGVMLVTGVGVNTEWGKLMSLDSGVNEKALERIDEQLASGEITEEEHAEKKEELEDGDDHETPLQIRLNGLATKIGKVGLTIAVIVLLVRIAKFLVYKYGSGNEDYGHGKSDSEILVHDISIAVTIVVVAVPEGLPLAVTLSLAYSMKRMYEDNSLVRRLKACEAMGGATNICSDKTGTLTTNRMTVVQAWLTGEHFKDQEKDCSDVTTKVPKRVLDKLIHSICMNSEVQLLRQDDGSPSYTGKPTEVALVKYAIQLGANLDEVREKFKVIKVDPFNSTKKKMGTLCQAGDGKYYVFWKGASEIVLDLCTHVAQEKNNGQLTAALNTELKGVIQNMAENSLRTICVAYKEVPAKFMKNFDAEADDLPDDGLVCLGITGIKDPCRPGVPGAVKRCQDAGIVVRMITGDNITTAKAIARECNILTEDGLAIEGKDFRVMSYAERIKKFGPKLEKMQVMARSSPSDKFDLVHMLRSLEEVVAVTGDGTNDARALREADIGCSMGQAGTEVAKQSSDIVILDDNFTTIVTMVRWGRCIYNNIQKFIAFQLTVNVVALTINFVGAVVPGADPPFSPVQLLWVNMIMDSMGALALGTEGPTEALMDAKPYGRKDPLVTAVMWRNILGQACFQLIVLFIFLFEGDNLFGLDKSVEHELTILNTLIFNTFVFCQIFNEMNARDMTKLNIFEGFFGNSLFVFIIFISAFFQVIIVEYFGKGASVASLSWQQWLITVGIAAITLPMGLVVKSFPVLDKDVFHLWLADEEGLNKQSQLANRVDDLEREIEELKAKFLQASNKV